MSIGGIYERLEDQKYQELLDVKDAVIFRLDRDGCLISLNGEWEKVTGRAVAECLGTPCSSYVASSDRELFESVLRELAQGRKDGEHQEIHLMNEWQGAKRIHLFIRSDRDHTGVCSFSGTMTDLTSRKLGIEHFLENESNFRFISDNLTDMVAVLAEDGLVLYASPSHETILGRSLDDYIGSFPITHIHPDDWEKVFHAFRQALTDWTVFEVDYRCKHEEGHWIEIEMRGQPMMGPDGKVRVLNVSRDVTKRKRAEEELRQTTLKLKTLIASLPFGIKVEDEHHQPILLNDVYKKLFLGGSAMPDGMEENQREIFDHRRTVQGEEMALSSGRSIERDAVPLMDRDRFEGYLWIYRDITEKKRIEQDLREANSRLRNLSMVDGLTGIANRRCFDEALDREWKRQPELPEPVSLLLFDLDHFKDYNDMYGHPSGDACLKLVGHVLDQFPWNTRDMAARYGGEEFAVLLPGRTLEEAMGIGSAILQGIVDLRIPHRGSSTGEWLTLSMGIAVKTADRFSTPASLIAEADKALYEAKRSGRNQIRVYCG